jgi:hypothetical protein
MLTSFSLSNGHKTDIHLHDIPAFQRDLAADNLNFKPSTEPCFINHYTDPKWEVKRESIWGLEQIFGRKEED